jgi:hypothetical protein
MKMQPPAISTVGKTTEELDAVRSETIVALVASEHPTPVSFADIRSALSIITTECERLIDRLVTNQQLSRQGFGAGATFALPQQQ